MLWFLKIDVAKCCSYYNLSDFPKGINILIPFFKKVRSFHKEYPQMIKVYIKLPKWVIAPSLVET